MFSIYSPITYRLWDASKQRYYFIGTEEILIRYIASTWQLDWWSHGTVVYSKHRQYWNDNWYFSSFFEQCACDHKDKGFKIYQIFDKDERIIQPLDYKEVSFQYFLSGKTYVLRYYFNKKYHRYLRQCKSYTYRYDPVPYIRKNRGGPSQRMRRVRPALLSMQDPAFKRGSKNQIPTEWDDKFKKRNIKNWKHQSKCRHQWQRGMKDQWLGQ